MIRRIEDVIADFIPCGRIGVANGDDASVFERCMAAPQFSVKRSGRKANRKPCRGVDTSASAGEELRSGPVGTDTVKFFGHQPTGRIVFGRVVSSKHHDCF